MEDVIIDFSANVEGLKPVIGYLRSIGQITDEQVKDFEKMNKLYGERAKKIADERVQIKGAAKDINDLAKGAQEVNKALAGANIGEATAKVMEHGKEVVEVTKKYASAKQELRDLTRQITSGELTGDNLVTAKNRAADLTDQIADARHEIGAMASDTRKFDLVVEGVRGVTAAFSVAQGVAALFGQENEDVQKALLKVQAAMALATGMQELANIATTQGGIATKAYGIALSGVEVIAKRTGLSMAASWALATGGLTILLSGVAALVMYLQSADEAVGDIGNTSTEAAAKAAEQQRKIQEDKLAALNNKDKEFFAEQEDRMNYAVNHQENTDKVKLALLESSLERFKSLYIQYQVQQNVEDDLNAEKRKERVATISQYILDSEKERIAIVDRINKGAEANRLEAGKRLGDTMKSQIDEARAIEKALSEGLSATSDHLKEFRDNVKDTVDEPMVTEQTVTENKDNAERMAKDLADAYKKAEAERITMAQATQQAAIEIAQAGSDAIFSILNEQFNADSEAAMKKLDKQRELELKNKDLTEAQKDAINQKYAKKAAELKKKDFERQKAASVIQAVINTALAVVNAMTTGDPYTAALRAAVAGALGAAQIAVIASQPIPEFAKGGKNIPAGMKLVGEKGPELMWTPGGETIIPHGDTAKILDAWSIPMPNLPNDMKGNNAFGMVMPAGMDYNKLGQVIADKLKENPRTVINIDRNGLMVHSMERGRNVEYINNYYNE